MKHWEQLSRAVANNYKDFDGFCVLHGTDTMAYTASALSFSFQDLAKPVVFTGAQIPLVKLRSDALQNLVDSCLVAAYSQIPEVVIVFSSHIFRANRTTKLRSFSISGFHSFNYPPLGQGGIRLVVNQRRLQPMPQEEFQCKPNFSCSVVIVSIFPGCEVMLEHMLSDSGIRGVILQAYGSGNAPSYRKLLSALESACKRGVVIVVVSQCAEGCVALESYAAGYALKEIGCRSGQDMTTEAAFTKLSWLLALVPPLTSEEIRTKMEEDLRGELTKGIWVSTTHNHRVIY